jgi:FlaA1/EpsC-like NDP-sugar epimerase
LFGIRFATKPLLVLTDALTLCIALLAAVWLKYDHLSFPIMYGKYIDKHLLSCSIVFLAYLLIYHRLRLYSYSWRFSSLEVLWSIMIANIIGICLLVFVPLVVDKSAFAKSVLIMFFMFNVAIVSGLRITLRILLSHLPSDEPSGIASLYRRTRKRVVILGAGSRAARAIRAINQDLTLNYEIIGLLDDRADKMGEYIGNARVMGPVSFLNELLEKESIDEVILALREEAVEENRKHIIEWRKQGINIKTMPNLRNVFHGHGHLRLEDITVEDLLRRKPRNTNTEDFGDYITGRRVLVTGAGGSIGSEICRQLAKLGPKQLILLGHGENSIFQIQQELKQAYPEISNRLCPVIACISNARTINHVFEKYRPEVVFHAAAHKHVPLMELNVVEAFGNNVFGTYNVVRACGNYGAARMVMISTDKAAEPHSIMGATKCLCENVVSSGADKWRNTAFIIVRFGNVLGSRGSVIPVFKEQIRNGGPVTVTHPEMTRYFMTIPEAARLVLQAGAVGKTRDLYLLDMGDPVKILDLAHDMIRLCGLEPDVDIEIEFTGVRPGEKLHERLTASNERLEPTDWDGLTIVRKQSPSLQQQDMDNVLARLIMLVQDSDEEGIVRFIEELVPEFKDRERVMDGISQIGKTLTDIMDKRPALRRGPLTSA